MMAKRHLSCVKQAVEMGDHGSSCSRPGTDFASRVFLSGYKGRPDFAGVRRTDWGWV